MSFTFEKTEIPGLFIVRPHYHEDERGSNMKTFHAEIFLEHGLDCNFTETMITKNLYKNTVRGFHFQKPPYTQSKLYYCLNGAFHNYSVDLRRGSPAYGKVVCFPMSGEDRKLLYIPKGIANAHLVLMDDTVVLYQLTSRYMPEYDAGIRWDSLGIRFPVENPVISKKDASLPAFEDFESPFAFGTEA